MKVLVDTCVWSLAVRRTTKRKKPPRAEELAELIDEGRVVIVGAVRQELLSGIRSAKQFEALRAKLAAFPDLELEREDHEEAARCFNTCRAAGVQGSNTDFLLCAVAIRRQLELFTTDRDFERYAEHVPLDLRVTRR